MNLANVLLQLTIKGKTLSTFWAWVVPYVKMDSVNVAFKQLFPLCYIGA